MGRTGVGWTGVRAESFRRIRFCGAARPLLEARPLKDHILSDNLNPVKDKQIGAIDKAVSTDVEPFAINVNNWREHESRDHAYIFMDPRTATIGSAIMPYLPVFDFGVSFGEM